MIMLNELKIEDFNDSFLKDNCEVFTQYNTYRDIFINTFCVENSKDLGKIIVFESIIKGFGSIQMVYNKNINSERFFILKRRDKKEEMIRCYVRSIDTHNIVTNGFSWNNSTTEYNSNDLSSSKVIFYVILYNKYKIIKSKIGRIDILDI